MCSYRVSLTVGHESAVSSGSEGEGGARARALHDWRLYVRGASGEDISRFVSKIVFTLHHSYTYPKRVIHEPPYEIRESGSGSFEVPIYIYIKHSINPSRIKFRYKLLLQSHKAQAGSQRFSHVFDNPPEPVKTCLIQGGAEIVEPRKKDAPIERKPDLFRYSADELSKISKRAFNKLTELFEPVPTELADMERPAKAAGDERELKRKRKDGAGDCKKRKTEESAASKPADKSAPKNESDSKKTDAKKNAVNGVKIRTNKGVKSDVKKRTNEPDGEKLSEAVVLDGLKKACKFVEMSSSEIDLVSHLYVSIRKYEKNSPKDSLRLPPFSDPVFQIPELPPSLRGLLAETEGSSALR